ncbi:autotransporter outer membrane beta-barrel domain-containing protein [Bradyrhizobium sp. HKCCYLS3077]|uniref:autotransporter outer membrane beta-barrel domain-containing protein n=1 Tax=Bradyrhizobium sp. HKCCYLS3077 TaxID=3420761 RepID=UPI003EB75DB1
MLPRTTNLFYGGMIGGDWQAGSGLRLGAFLGGGQTRSSADFNFGTTNADLVFGGAYARYDLGASFLNAAVQAGGSRNTASRTINNNLVAGGLETAAANFNGWYVSPEATFGHRWGLGSLGGATYTLTPSFRLRYLYGSYAGYTETGTTAPLTVNGQTVSLLEERGEMKLTRSVVFAPTDVLSTSITAGLLGTHKVGSNTVNASLLGQAIPFAIPGQSNVWGGFGGLGLEWQSRNVTLFSAAEYLALSDRSNVVSGRAGLRVSF